MSCYFETAVLHNMNELHVSLTEC